MKIEESLNVTFDETPPPSKTSPLVDDDLDKEEAIKLPKAKIKKRASIIDETYAPVARLESIRILLAYACALDFKLCQMDVKSTFLNGLINEEVYVAQPLRLIDFEKPDHVYKLKKALYGLKQAPKACVPTSEPYQTDPHFPDEIKNYVQEEREGPITRIHHDVVVDVEENQILTREIHYNLAYFIAKRIEFVTKQPRLILPDGMLLTRLFKYVMSKSLELSNDRYVLYDRVMYPLTAQQERKTRKDYGTRRGRSSTFSSSAFGQPSSCHLNDDDNDRNDEGTSRASTPSPTHFVNH
ncbi:retrovirus-related pol polyprotein from transposon TNT 1-94 [Tanacetum coccineum]